MKKHDYFSGVRPLAFAHRGGANRFPENTLLAFRGAIELGFTHIETDVHLTRDGEFVCFHDDRLERTTNGVGFVRDHDLASLRKLDAAYHFRDASGEYSLRGKGVQIPTLDEALALDASTRFNIEIKPRDPVAVHKLVELIFERGLEDRILLAAADDATNRLIRKLSGGKIATSPGAQEVFLFWLLARLRLSRLWRPSFDALQVPIKHGPLRVIEPRFIKAAHQYGIQVHVWTIDDEEEMGWLKALDVDGIMTDDPELLLRTLGRLK